MFMFISCCSGVNKIIGFLTVSQRIRIWTSKNEGQVLLIFKCITVFITPVPPGKMTKSARVCTVAARQLGSSCQGNAESNFSTLVPVNIRFFRQ